MPVVVTREQRTQRIKRLRENPDSYFREARKNADTGANHIVLREIARREAERKSA